MPTPAEPRTGTPSLRRRLCQFLAHGYVAALLPALAQPKPRTFAVGFLASGTASSTGLMVDTFRKAMRGLGWVEGRNVAYV